MKIKDFVRVVFGAIFLAIFTALALCVLVAASPGKAQAFPFGTIQKTVRLADATLSTATKADTLRRKYRRKAPAIVACSTDSDCCTKNPKLCKDMIEEALSDLANSIIQSEINLNDLEENVMVATAP